MNQVSGKTSPKFERAKFVSIQQMAKLYISGTASIIGQESKPGQNAEQQTITTIENIQELISDTNLKNHQIEVNSSPLHLSYLRVYVKNNKNLKEVKRVCEKYCPRVPTLYLVSDICRKELLVEIEGIAEWG